MKKFEKNKLLTPKKIENEIYISRKRKNIEKFYFERAYELIYDKNFKEIYICGLGSCVNFAVRTALLISNSIPGVKVDKIDTQTVNYLDEYKDENNV